MCRSPSSLPENCSPWPLPSPGWTEHRHGNREMSPSLSPASYVMKTCRSLGFLICKRVCRTPTCRTVQARRRPSILRAPVLPNFASLLSSLKAIVSARIPVPAHSTLVDHQASTFSQRSVGSSDGNGATEQGGKRTQ